MTGVAQDETVYLRPKLVVTYRVVDNPPPTHTPTETLEPRPSRTPTSTETPTGTSWSCYLPIAIKMHSAEPQPGVWLRVERHLPLLE
jgi:hypothetical protein